MKSLSNKLNSIEEVCKISHLQDVNTDLILSLVGEKIGSGIHRKVYEYNLNPKKYVIKLETENTEANMTEFLLWDEIQGLKGPLAWVKEWFAPILWVSPNKKILVMERTKELPKKTRPKKIPAFFMDVKQDNFGWIGNKFVCHDYGFIYRFIKYEKKFQNIKW